RAHRGGHARRGRTSPPDRATALSGVRGERRGVLRHDRARALTGAGAGTTPAREGRQSMKAPDGDAGGEQGFGRQPEVAISVPPSFVHCVSFLTGAQSSPVTMDATSFAGRQHAWGFFFGVFGRPHADLATAFLSAFTSADFFCVLSSFLISPLTHFLKSCRESVWQLQVPLTAVSVIWPRISPA